MASFCSARKLSSYLFWAKLYPFFKCGSKRCEVCLNLAKTETFTSTSTNQTYKINHEFNGNESSLIYLLTCNICRKQYAGQTIDILPSRWNNYD